MWTLCTAHNESDFYLYFYLFYFTNLSNFMDCSKYEVMIIQGYKNPKPTAPSHTNNTGLANKCMCVYVIVVVVLNSIYIFEFVLNVKYGFGKHTRSEPSRRVNPPRRWCMVHRTQDKQMQHAKQNAALLLHQWSVRQRFDPPSGSMQYWREEQSPCGVCRGCCRLLRQEKERRNIDIQRHEETASPDILRMIANEFHQSLDLRPSRPVKSAERQHLTRCRVFREKKKLWPERNPPTLPPWGQGVPALPPGSIISPLKLQVEPAAIGGESCPQIYRSGDLVAPTNHRGWRQ